MSMCGVRLCASHRNRDENDVGDDNRRKWFRLFGYLQLHVRNSEFSSSTVHQRPHHSWRWMYCRLLKMHAHSMGSVPLFRFFFQLWVRVHTNIYVRCIGWWWRSATICNIKRKNTYNFDIDKRCCRRRVVGIAGFSVHRSFVVSTRHICLFVRRTVMPQQHFHQRFPRLSSSTSLALYCPRACVRWLKRNINGSGTTPMASNHQLVFDKIRSCWLTRFC